MERYFPALLPILWTLVATVVALALYKTSSAFFEQTETGEKQTRRLRIVGSVVIAALVFLGLWRATPKEAQTGLARDEAVVERVKLRAVRDAAAGLEAAVTELEGCTALTKAQECGSQVQSLRARSDALGSAVEGLPGEAEK